MKVILASASPRRSQLLTEAGVEFDVIPSDVDEVVDKTLSPRSLAESLARQKAECVYKKRVALCLALIPSWCLGMRF